MTQEYELLRRQTKDAKFELVSEFPDFRAAQAARDTSIKANHLISIHDYMIRVVGAEFPSEFQLLVTDPDNPDREVMIDSFEILDYAEAELAYEVSLGKIPAECFRILEVETT